MQYTTLARDVCQPLLRLTMVLLLSFAGLNAAWAVIIFGVAAAAAAVLLLHFLNNLFSLRRSIRSARYDAREIASFSMSVYLSDLMQTFQGTLQTLFLGALNTIANVGIFAVANQITYFGNQLQSAITASCRPIIAELYDQGDRTQMGRVYQTATKWMITVNLPLFLLLVLFPTPILAIFGKSFVAGSTALMLLACASIADVLTGMCGAVIDMTGYTKLKLGNSIVRLALSLSVNALLIPRWGIVGAAMAALVATGALNLLRMLEVFILFRLLPYNVSTFKPLVAGFVTLVVILATSSWLPSQTNYLFTVIQIAMLFAVYTGIILTLGLSAEDRVILRHLRQRLAGRFSRSGK
jgi:O-antigen/teichoic acid export membrane protein